MTERASDTPQSDHPPGDEPPRLQDTTERASLPLPLPDSPAAAQAAADEPAAASSPTSEDAAAAAQDEPDAQASASPGSDGSNAGAGSASSFGQPSQPSYASASGPVPPEATDEPPRERPEVLVGAAFVGGVCLALLVRGLASR
jgi:hypothetical protein